MIQPENICRKCILPEKIDLNEIFEIIVNKVIQGIKLIANFQAVSQINKRDIEFYKLKDNLIDPGKNLDKDIKVDINPRTGKIFFQGNLLLRNIFDDIIINAIKYNPDILETVRGRFGILLEEYVKRSSSKIIHKF